MKIRIKNDTGLPKNTLVTDENGKELESITNIKIDIDHDGNAAMLTFALCPIDIKTDAYVTFRHLEELANHHGYKLCSK